MLRDGLTGNNHSFLRVLTGTRSRIPGGFLLAIRRAAGLAGTGIRIPAAAVVAQYSIVLQYSIVNNTVLLQQYCIVKRGYKQYRNNTSYRNYAKGKIVPVISNKKSLFRP